MEIQAHRNDTIIVVLSVVALLISSISTYINFFYNKNELSVAITRIYVTDSTLVIDLSWINSGNKSISLSDITIAISNDTYNSNSITEDFDMINSLFLNPGDIIQKSLRVKHINQSLSSEKYPNLIAMFSLISSGGTFSKQKLVFGKVSFVNDEFIMNGPIVDLKSNLKTNSTSSSNKQNNVVKFSL